MRWETVPLRQLITPTSTRNRADLPLLSVVREKGVIARKLDKSDNHNVIPEDLSNYKVVLNGQFVMNKMKAWQGSCGVSLYDGIVSPAYFVFDLNIDNPRFFNYAIRSMYFVDEFNRISKGIRVGQWDLDIEKLKNVGFSLPPRNEQDQIVRYLDWKVSQINKLIGAKRRQIVLLKEQKRVFINQTLTKGGESWHTFLAKYLFAERNERSEYGTETHLSMSQKYGLVNDEQLDERRMLSESYQGGKICYENDIVLNRLKAHLGVFALAPQKGVISPDYTVLQPCVSKILPKYAEYFLKSDVCRHELRIRVRGVVEGFWRLYTEDFNTISVPTPTLDEQTEILSRLDRENDRIEKLVHKLNDKIALFTEYRTRLISDVVTGKVDVRNVVVPEYEILEDTADDGETGDGTEET